MSERKAYVTCTFEQSYVLTYGSLLVYHWNIRTKYQLVFDWIVLFFVFMFFVFADNQWKVLLLGDFPCWKRHHFESSEKTLSTVKFKHECKHVENDFHGKC